MPDNNVFNNALLTAIEQQRNEAMNKLAHSQAQVSMLLNELQELKIDNTTEGA